MLRRIVLAVFALTGAIWTSAALGQYIFLDADRDGVSGAQDHLVIGTPSSIDIWLQTNANRDGSSVPVALGRPLLTINSYEFVLRAVGGTVTWGKYTNLQPTMYVPFRRLENESEIYVGYGGTEPLPPGKYKLGTLVATVKSGDPRLEFLTRSSIYAGALTSFGSKNPGKDDDNTLKFTMDRNQLGSPLADVSGDWADADGLAAPSAGIGLAASHPGESGLSFAVSVTPNPGRSGEMQLRVTTTRPGALHVRLFDLQGRLVRTLVSDDGAPAGTRTVDIAGKVAGGPHLASGIYLYKIDSVDGQKTGRIVLLR